ncbi:hypothetical protein GGS23DRAFT_520814 [Durotheca rogersii]|uniref:uncharacterized protein n=1 Tax=Durotheca rogersii TaxID=419775 RepID=UPI0022200102|nr:uncharacterized protein GGS23DRAFT_520814 [Durotheca rogersii]KAI5863929.1 hypothetical protein GGS23DRAFT_520814 [Durotheca rogersii]
MLPSRSTYICRLRAHAAWLRIPSDRSPLRSLHLDTRQPEPQCDVGTIPPYSHASSGSVLVPCRRPTARETQRWTGGGWPTGQSVVAVSIGVITTPSVRNIGARPILRRICTHMNCWFLRLRHGLALRKKIFFFFLYPDVNDHTESSLIAFPK